MHNLDTKMKKKKTMKRKKIHLEHFQLHSHTNFCYSELGMGESSLEAQW